MATNTDDITTTAKHDFEDAAARGRSVASQAREVSEFTGTFKDAIDKSLKDQPMTTLAMAAGLGLVLGALWKR